MNKALTKSTRMKMTGVNTWLLINRGNNKLVTTMLARYLKEIDFDFGNDCDFRNDFDFVCVYVYV
jgi:hypothetical protein